MTIILKMRLGGVSNSQIFKLFNLFVRWEREKEALHSPFHSPKCTKMSGLPWAGANSQEHNPGLPCVCQEPST